MKFFVLLTIFVVERQKRYLSFAKTDIPCSKMGTTVWSRYARVGKDCKSTLGFFDGVSMHSFSLEIIF